MSDYSVTRLQAGEEKLWNSFLQEAINSTFYSTIPFLDFYAHKVNELLKLVFWKKNKIIALFPAGLVGNYGSFSICSPFSASFGGFVHNENLTIEDSISIVEMLNEYAYENNIKSINITQPPSIYCKYHSDIIEYSLLVGGFSLESYEVSPYLPLSGNLDNKFCSSTSWAINKLSKNNKYKFELKVNRDNKSSFDLIRGHREKNGIIFPYVFEEINKLSELTSKVYFFELLSEGELFASCFAYALNEYCLICMHWAYSEEVKLLRPMPLFIKMMATWASDNNFKFMDFGTTTVNGVPNLGLTRFKENFRPLKVMRKTWSRKL